jgi:tetratricopeptide (TPR) repeat protein/membrane protease YdiL (CAAX protease family)
MSTDLPDPAPQPHGEAAPLWWLPTIAIAVLVPVFSNFVVGFVVAFVRAVSAPGQPITRPDQLSLVFHTTVSLILQITILTMVVQLNGYRIGEYFRLRLPRIRDAILGIAATGGLLALYCALNFRNGGVVVQPVELEQYQSASDAGVLPLLFIAVVLVAPLGEEMVYRGFVFRGLEDSRIGVVGAVIVSTLLWTALHIDRGARALVFIAVLGLLFGWLRVRSQSTLLTWLLHAITNLTVVAVMALQIGSFASGHAHSVAFSNACLLDVQNQNDARAIKECSEAIEHDSAYAMPYANRGLAYFRTGDINHAMADFDEVIRIGNFANDHDRSVTFMNRCAAQNRIKNYARAIEDCTEAIGVEKTNAKAYSDRGNAYYGTGDVDRAMADFDEAIRLDPALAIAYNNRGLVYARKGDKVRAIADYDKTIQVDPKYAPAYVNRGLAYAGIDDDRAIADYDRAIGLDPKLAVAYLDRGLAYSRKRVFDQAIADYDRSIAIDGNNAATYAFRGDAYLSSGFPLRGIAEYDRAIALNPKYASAYGKRGGALRDMGDFVGAIADYTQAIVLDSKYANAYYGRGLAKIYVGASADAAEDLTLSVQLNPKFPYGAIWLEIANLRSNLPSRLKQATEQIDMSKWPAPVIRLYLGELSPAEVLAAAADPDATKNRGQTCEANFYTGELALQNGNKDEAARLFRLAAADCPKTFDEFSAANAELKALGMRP